ncbi:MAG: insulinase family protein [Candidatus Moranbacteria bacterium]|nr:insulinase family protein [Candidatus Moranbacteria bacterium]
MKHKIEKLKLANGAMLVNVIVKNLPITIVSAWFRAGSRFDQNGKEGTAHLLEHLLIKRTKKYTDTIERLKDIESNGIKFNAFTSYETAHYYYTQPKAETCGALDFLIDGLENYAFNDVDIEEEKKAVINELMENRANPREYIWELSNGSLWNGLSMGKQFFGNKKSIKSINRKDLQGFIDKYYTSENCSFLVVGDGNTEKIGKYLNAKLILNDSKKPKLIKEKSGKPKKISIINNDESQAMISVAFKTLSMDADPLEIAVIDFIRDYLANNWTSKLIEELRLKKNVTYWVDGASINFSDTGMLRFTFACNKKNVTESIKIVLDEIEKLKINSFDDGELAMHKKSFLSSMIMRFVDPYEYLWWYGWQVVVSDGKNVVNVEEYLKIIQKIKGEDIARIALKYLNRENMSISIIGDVEKADVILA